MLNTFSLLIFHHCQSAIVLLEVYNRLFNRPNINQPDCEEIGEAESKALMLVKGITMIDDDE